MQNKPKPKGQAHDDDLLLASNVSAFKQWLIAQDIAVQEPVVAHKARGVHYWVDIPGCKPVSVQEGTARKARYAQTHYRLRPLLNSFLTSPMASAIKAIVRTKTPSPVMTVVDRKVQPVAAANSDASTGADIASNNPEAVQPTGKAIHVKPLDKFLVDLRDDFAISCPLKVRGDESMASFANRRWEYAQAMLDARPQ